MYLYFDEHGILREIVKYDDVRLGSDQYNTIYAYFKGSEELELNVWFTLKRPDGSLSREEPIDKVVTTYLPFDETKDLKFFEDYKKYKFFVKTLTSEEINQNGLYSATFRYQLGVANILSAQGMLTFNVQNNVVKSDHNISQSQYDYLIEYVSKSVSQIIGAYVKKVQYDNSSYILTFTLQDDSKLIVDLPDEDQIANIQLNKENIARLEQVLNNALNNINLDDSYNITATTVGGSSFRLDLSQIAINKQDIGTIQNDIGVIRGNVATNKQDIDELKIKALQINTNTQNIELLEESDARQNDRLLAIEEDIANLNGIGNEVVKVTPQNFSNLQKEQARKNIGVDVSQFIPASEKNAPNGVATLDKDGFLSPNQVPGHLDEVVSGTYVNETTFKDRKGNVVTPKDYCIYFDYKTKLRYGWSGTEYVSFTSGGLVLGIDDGTAYEGSKGEANRLAILKKQDKLSATQLNNINAVPNKLDKVTTKGQVYTTDGATNYSTSGLADTFVKRTSDGRIKAYRPEEDDDVVTKAYMKDFGGKTDATDLFNILEGQNNIAIEKNSDSTKVIIKTSGLVSSGTIATGDSLGLVKIGDDFDITADGKISLYHPIEIKSFTNNVGSVAKGQTINEVVLTWSTSKVPTTITIDNQAVTPNTLTTKTFSNLGLKTNKTFTLKVVDNRNKQSTMSTSINFNNYVLYGASTTFNESVLTKVLKTTRVGTYKVNAKANEHIYFSIPATLGTPTFFVGGFEGGFVLDKTYSWNNGHGYTESYNVYKSSQVGLGETSVEVK